MKKLNLYFVLGGAVSAGAYTAGVLDFFVSRLKEYMALDNDKRKYNIQIKAIAGTSAGGMCGSILFHGLAKGYPYSPGNSDLFRTWVEDIDISALSKLDDMKEGQLPNALLNGNALRKIADQVFDELPTNTDLENYNFIANDCKLILSVTDTVGKSYEINFVNDTAEKPYYTTNHRDYYYVCLKCSDPNYIVLSNRESWDKLKEITLATGAFPIGLPPIKLERPASDYNNDPLGKPINIGGEIHSYYGIDGGVGDNEPFGQLIEMLESDKKNGNESAVILVDPFPSDNKYLKGDSIGVQLHRLYSTFRNQSAYKPEEISNFQGGNYKCYSIIPKQSSDTKIKNHLAGSFIGAFSGFIHQKYRYFDYQLGLRNCQRFLSKTFSYFEDLPERDEVVPVEWPWIGKKEYKSKTKALDKRIKTILKTTVKKLPVGPLFLYLRLRKKQPSDLVLNVLMKQKLVVK